MPIQHRNKVDQICHVKIEPLTINNDALRSCAMYALPIQKTEIKTESKASNRQHEMWKNTFDMSIRIIFTYYKNDADEVIEIRLSQKIFYTLRCIL